MPSLRALVEAHGPILVLDATSTLVQVGVLEGPNRARWAASTDEAGVAIFRNLEALGVQPRQMGAFVFAEGPGSVLGIRLAAMALRIWTSLAPRPVFAYHALAVLARASGRSDLTFIADARRGEWHCGRAGEAPTRRPTEALAGPLATSEQFRHWMPLPAGVERVPYLLEELLPRVADADLFHPVDAPDAFLSEPPHYATWSPQVHRLTENTLSP